MYTEKFRQSLKSKDFNTVKATYSEIEESNLPPNLKSSFLSLLKKKLEKHENFVLHNLSASCSKFTKTTKAERIALGHSLLGPILLVFYSRLLGRLSNENHNRTKSIYFLAREGYLLKKGFDIIQESFFSESNKYNSHYLLASRSIVSRLCFDNPDQLQYIQRHPFNGNLRQFMEKRVKLNDESINNLISTAGLEDEQQASMINLQKLSEAAKKIDMFANEKNTYIEYLKSIDFLEDEKPIVVDLGYSGTIQDLLSGLTGKNMKGYYMITCRTDESKTTKLTNHKIGLLFSNLSWGGDIDLLEKSLILETLLTSPTGSCISIAKMDDEFSFGYGTVTNAQRRFDEIEDIFNHGVEYVLNHMNKPNHALSPLSISRVYATVCKSGLLSAPSIASLLEIEDEHSGNSIFQVASLFS